MIYRTIIFAALCLLLAGCSGSQHDARLQQLAAQIDDDPHAVVEALDSLNSSTFSEADRHYYDLLLIKARDKAYVVHTSDSLILDVINYYADHQDDDLYAEALYYGGRVYSDMGDYPSALHYFQSALDLLPADTPNLKLRGNVLSQTGRLLNELRLYDQAAPYIKDVIQLDSICNDSINWMYDLQLLGAIYLHAEKYPESKTAIHHARRLAHKVSPADTIQQDLYLAAIKYYNIETDSALTLIRDVPRLINPIAYNNAAAYAADIYLQANSLDSAYMYANELIHADATLDRITGYHTVLSSSLIHRIPTDSIIPYVLDYRISIESLLEQNGNQQALLQNSIYNYSIHERERQKAENTQLKLQRSIICILAIVSILIIGLFYLKYRNKVQLLQLHEALRNISALREELDRKDNVENLAIVNDNQEELRNQLRLELLSLQQSGNDSAEILHDIINHPTYHKLQQYIETNKIITDRDTIWGDIEKMVCTYSQNFKSRLMLLTNGKLTSDDYRIALLIKCGVTPTQLTKLIGRTKGTVSYKRSMLCMRIFDQKLGAKIIDDIIRLL